MELSRTKVSLVALEVKGKWDPGRRSVSIGKPQVCAQ